MTETVRVRFAPSPTGQLHVGNARTALYNWLFARQQKGTYILRVEDTDIERSEERFEQALVEDLRWLGLDWDEGPDVSGPLGPYRQSQRLALYLEHAEILIERGYAYYCFCSPEELEAERQRAQAEGRIPKYSGRCLHLAIDEARARRTRREPAIVRLRVPEGPVRFTDRVRGEVEFASDVIGDLVLLRSDGRPTYNYAVVVDDHLMQITHVIRGDDHISNTPRQILLYQAFGWAPPAFAHLSTILGPDHTRLSKRHGATSVAHFREMGLLPEALANYLALLGWGAADGVSELFTLPELVQAFALERAKKHAAVFDLEKLKWLNRHYLRQASLERLTELVLPRLEAAGYGPLASAGTEVRGWVSRVVEALVSSIDLLGEVAERAGILFRYNARASLELAENRDVLERDGAREVIRAFGQRLLDGNELSLERFKRIVEEVKSETRARGRNLFQPIRVALTGLAHGPELDRLVPLIEEGSRLPLAPPVKSCRERLLEFCAVLPG